MTDLTKQWKKGELPNDEYYVVNKYNVIEKVRYCKEFKGFCDNEKDLVKEVLAEVPDYIEWQNMVNCACEEHKANTELLEENAQFKELLKECKEMLKKSITYQCMDRANHYIKKIENDIYEPILAKIDEVLK